MPKQDYDWQRFWCPRSSSIKLDNYSGYLPDPSSDWGRACNPELVSFADIAGLPCLVLLGEAGMGKTTAIEDAHKQISENTQTSEDVCLPLFRLGAYGSDTELCNAIFRNQTFQAWLSGTHNLHLFLDSLDEGLLSIKILVRILKREIEQLPCDRLYFRITCRTSEWAPSLEEALIEKWGKDNVRVYALAPLRHQDVIEAATKNSIIDVDSFLQAVSGRNAVPLAIKPITLQFLIDIYGKEAKLPSSQIELYEEGCLQLCEEVNPDRCEAGEKGKLSAKKRMLIASRIAAVMIFCRRSAVWTSPEYGKKGDFDIAIQDLCIGKEKADDQELDVEEDHIREAFKVTGLFSEQECNQRIGFGHRTYAEFLAAWYLTQRNVNLPQILSLILHPDRKVVPQLQETTAWLGSMRSDVFQEVVKTDPNVLLQSDIATATDSDKATLVKSLLRAYDEQRLPHSYNGFWRYQHLSYPQLLDDLREYITDSSKHESARLTAIDISRACNIKDIQSDLLSVALSLLQPYWLRVSAASTLCQIGDEDNKKELKGLAIGVHDDDPEDYLKGYALQAVFPKHLPIEELLENITSPKSQMIGDAYSDFLAKDLAEKLSLQDTPTILWLTEKFPRRYGLSYPLQDLSDSVMLKAWENCDQPEILNAFANLAITRLKNHDRLLGSQARHTYTRDSFDSTRDDDIDLFLRDSDTKRRKLIETIVSLSLQSENDYLWLVQIIAAEDILWIIQNAISAESDKEINIWIKLSSFALNTHNLRWKDAKYADAILNARDVSPAVKAAIEVEFEFDLIPLELGSQRAEQIRATYLQYQIQPHDPGSLLDPSPTQRVAECLESFEAGNFQAWLSLNLELTLLPNSQRYDHIWRETDITKLPGWKNADSITQSRIVKAAEVFIQNWQSGSSGLNLHEIDVAAYKALRLLSLENSHCLVSISPAYWQEFARIILLIYYYVSDSRNVECHHALMKAAYYHAPQESLDTFIELIDEDDRRYRDLHTLDAFRDCWDDRSLSVLSQKLLDNALSPQSIGRLLKVLLSNDFENASNIAESFIPQPLPADAQEREKAVFAALSLMMHTKDAGWSVIWRTVQEDPSFGQELFKKISYLVKWGGELELKLQESHIADLYIFLFRNFSNTEIEKKKDLASNKNRLVYEDGFDSNSYMFDGNRSINIWKNYIPQRLQERGTPEACDALRKIIHELPELKDQLQWRLLEAEALARRNTWKPPTSEEFLRFVISQEPSNLDLSTQLDVIDQRTKKMEDEPKIENKINISNSPNSPINAPVGTSGVTNNNVTIASSDVKKGVNWGNWLAVIGILVAIVAIPLSMSVSGAFNEEFKEWFNHIFHSKVEQQPVPKSK